MQGRDVILGLLSERQHTGYEIKTLIEKRLKYFFDGTIGMIYPTLKKLEKEGKVEKMVVLQEGKPNKNVYTITDSGREEFDAYLKSAVSPEIIKSDFLMRLNFGKSLAPERVRELVEEELARKKADLALMTEVLPTWQETGMVPAQTLVFEYGKTYYQSVIALLEAFLAEN